MARILRLKDPHADGREARPDSSGNKHHALNATLLLRSRPEAPDFKGRQEMIAEAEKALVLVPEARKATKLTPLFSDAYIREVSRPPIHEETTENGEAPADADDKSPTEDKSPTDDESPTEDEEATAKADDESPTEDEEATATADAESPTEASDRESDHRGRTRMLL